MSKEEIKKLKQKIAAILGIGIASLGGIQININVDTNKFYEELADGKLYVSSFNQKAYKGVMSDLIDDVDDYIAGGEPLTYQALQTYMKIVSNEAGEDTFIAEDKTYKEEDGHLVVTGTKETEKVGWEIDGDSDEFLKNINEKLKTKL